VVNPPVAARLRDLTAPQAKMSKSSASDAGVLLLLDEPETLRRKVMRAVTDSGDEVRYDPAGKPGLSNLLDVLAACTGGDPRLLAADFDRYGELKAAVADAVVAAVDPIRQRAVALEAEPEYVRKVLRAGAERARELATGKVRRVKEAIGLLEY
jgi:tryptophanyl-tRNA synthetase